MAKVIFKNSLSTVTITKPVSAKADDTGTDYHKIQQTAMYTPAIQLKRENGFISKTMHLLERCSK